MAAAERVPEDAPAAESARPFQFSLRELFWVMGGVCVVGGAYSWLGTELAAGLACIVAVFFVTYRAAKKQLNEALVVTMMVGLFIALILPVTPSPRGSSRRVQCQINLHNLALALHNYHDVYGSFPPAYIADENGKPMHSWRVLLLPFIEQRNLYDLYRFDEPWDGPNNSKLRGTRLLLYACPSDSSNQAGMDTSYVAVVGPQTMWPDDKTTTLADIKDGTSRTLMLVELRNSGIHWMEPRDLDFVQMPMAINPPRGIGISSPHPKIAQAALADGAVRVISEDTPPTAVRAMLTIDGGEKVEVP